MKTVYVVGGDLSVVRMFEDEGWEAHAEFSHGLEPDLICFTGGADVSPHLYGEENTGLSHCDPDRDEFELSVYKEFEGRVPMIGICRGGQFLNVMNGGKLIQDHGLISGVVSAWSLYEQDGEEHKVHVDHHQGILPTDKADGFIYGPDIPSGEHIAYSCHYLDTQCLCFQPHPEWGHEPTRNLFFDLLEKYL